MQNLQDEGVGHLELRKVQGPGMQRGPHGRIAIAGFAMAVGAVTLEKLRAAAGISFGRTWLRWACVCAAEAGDENRRRPHVKSSTPETSHAKTSPDASRNSAQTDARVSD